MRCRVLLVALSVVCISALPVATVQAQDLPEAPPTTSPQTQGADGVIEGVVVSTTRDTLVVRSEDNRYHLFTRDARTVLKGTVKPGERVRVIAGAPDAGGTQAAESITAVEPGSDPPSVGQNSQAAPPPPKVRHVTNRMESETRRWHGGGRIGFGFSPELFMFGLQSQIGPFFNPRLLFRPNIEFGFGELTDMFAINLEGAYRMRTTFRGRWTPYFGMGPSLNFIHQGASSGDVSFSNFTYKTGFNVFVGGQKDKMFVEMKTALWSGPSPVLRLFLGYNF